MSRSHAVGGWCGQGVRRGPFQGEGQHLSVRRAQRVSAGRPAGGTRGRHGCDVGQEDSTDVRMRCAETPVPGRLGGKLGRTRWEAGSESWRKGLQVSAKDFQASRYAV